MNEKTPTQSAAAPKHPPHVDGLLLDYQDLLPGDILLFRAIDPDPLARRVSKTIGSPYTHAGIYLGGGELIEAGDPRIEIRRLSSHDKEDSVIGVFRSQNTFLDDRVRALREFAETLVRNGAEYDWDGVRAFRKVRTQLEEELFEILKRDYGKVLTKSELDQRSYFCSALIVACYIVSGVIGDTAQLAYKADAFSPADLHEDPTFGWFLGYITSQKNEIPADDPLLNTTLWRDVEETPWWAGRAPR
ncbi:hypothetical protein XH97_02160 [Bradyrhizobium sp. CCBAU 53380]|nr:hypothetical protein [Bradyrhizobium sp. CCBAU 53380]